MSQFELLLQCIRSGQMTEGQLSAEMRDPQLQKFYEEKTMCDPEKKPEDEAPRHPAGRRHRASA